MILNSRKRRQIRQQHQEGQSMVVSFHKQLVDDGIDIKTADTVLSAIVALGSAKGSWWADVAFIRRAKGYLRKKAMEPV